MTSTPSPGELEIHKPQLDDNLLDGALVSFSERRLSLLRVEVYEALATATGEIRVWLRL